MGKRSDQWNMLKKQTFKRSANALKVWSSYHYSKWTGTPKHWGSPISIAFEPTTACNLGCPECPSGLKKFTRDTGNLKKELYQNVIDQIADRLSYLTFYFQGEPYIHPEFTDMVHYASSKGIYTATSTNAHFLTPAMAEKTVQSGLDRLIISIDGTTQDTYQSYRKNGNLDKVLEGARNMIEAKRKLNASTPHVIFQFLVVRPNEHQMEEVLQLGREVGVDEVKFKTAQVYDYKNGNPLIPTNEKYSRYRKNSDGTYSIKNRLSNHCWRMWQACVITWDGLVVPCCFDKDATHRLGDLKENSFEQVWGSEAYQNFRGAVIGSRSQIEICKNCTEGTKVWA